VLTEADGQGVVARRLPDDEEEVPMYLWQNAQDDKDEGFPAFHASSQASGLFLFSEVLSTFTPSMERIFLARTLSGVDLFCPARDLCHVALAGPTGEGKSSIMRLLMAQLVYAGATVLLLDPHYTGYDIEKQEDWTPFERHLHRPPTQCRDYKVIGQYLQHTAETLIPERLEKRANYQPTGTPTFLVIDELPSIIRKVRRAPEWMSTILEEGRKVGVYLISAAHNFLVKTISPDDGGGSIRDCYRTAYYAGGDPTTAKVLLGMAPSELPEGELGKGRVMLRNTTASKRAQLVRVPYVDNAALYRLLGPSTYYKAGEQQQAGRPDLHDQEQPPRGQTSAASTVTVNQWAT
jgi:hypothetical protein